jgi:Family of unknown function (DUF6299)
MRRAEQVILITAVGLATLFVVPAAALGQPANDTWPGQTISSVPFRTSEDTTQATTDSADTAAAQACNVSFGSFTNSVWFAFTPTSDQTLALTTGGSSYSVAFAVLTGTPAAFSSVSCFFGSTTFQATQGTTYYIDLLDFGGGSGGTLSFSLAPLIPPNPVLTVNSSGGFDRSGAATVSGTASCGTGSSAFLSGSLTQHVGRLFTVSGSGSAEDRILCDGTPHPWSFVVIPSSGVFKGGSATAAVTLSACNIACDSKQVTQTIQLKH